MNMSLYRGAIKVSLDDECGAIYLDIETRHDGSISFPLNELQIYIDKFEAKRKGQVEEVEREQIFNNFVIALDKVLEIM